MALKCRSMVGILRIIPLDGLRTLSAEFIIRHLRRPRPLVIRAWFWLAAQSDHLDKKRTCVEVALELHPESEAAGPVRALLHQRSKALVAKTSVAGNNSQSTRNPP